MQENYFDGPAAWEVYCARIDAELAELRRANPGCGTCEYGNLCPCCGKAYCMELASWCDQDKPECEYELYEQSLSDMVGDTYE